MFRRSSEYIRGRSSVVLVREARGAPYKILSIILASFFTACGLRDLFFCATPFTSDPKEELLLSAFKDCKTDIYQEGVSGMLGTLLIVVAMMRFHMCFAETTADLYKSMIPLVFTDVVFLFLGLRPGWGR